MSKAVIAGHSDYFESYLDGGCLPLHSQRLDASFKLFDGGRVHKRHSIFGKRFALIHPLNVLMSGMHSISYTCQKLCSSSNTAVMAFLVDEM